MGQQGEKKWAEHTSLWCPCAQHDCLGGDLMSCRTSLSKHFIMVDVSAAVLVVIVARWLTFPRNQDYCGGFETLGKNFLAQGVEDV